jgi:hypothetical protein
MTVSSGRDEWTDAKQEQLDSHGRVGHDGRTSTSGRS